MSGRVDESLYQWIVEWVWVPVTVALAETFRQLIGLRAEINRLHEQRAEDARRYEMTITALRNLEGAIHGNGERLANIEGYLDGKN